MKRLLVPVLAFLLAFTGVSLAALEVEEWTPEEQLLYSTFNEGEGWGMANFENIRPDTASFLQNRYRVYQANRPEPDTGAMNYVEVIDACVKAGNAWDHSLSVCVSAPGSVAVTEETALPEPEILTLQVAEMLVACTGVAPRKCLLVRESANTDWELFYDDIEGFVYEAGNRYTLKLQKNMVENPPADASAYRWELLDIISQRTVPNTVELQSFTQDRLKQDLETPTKSVGPTRSGALDDSTFNEGEVNGELR